MALTVTSEFRALSDRLCRAAGFSPAVAFEADDVATVRALVGAGLGLAILPARHQPAASTARPGLDRWAAPARHGRGVPRLAGQLRPAGLVTSAAVAWPAAQPDGTIGRK